MIQRVQSLLLFFAAITSVAIIYYAPVLHVGDSYITLEDKNYQYARISLLASSLFSIVAIFQFRNRKRQIILCSLSRLLITACLVLLLMKIDDRVKMFYGLFVLLVPYLTIFLAGYFIKKDDKLVRSADRIR